MSEPRDPHVEFHGAVVELGRAIRDAPHLPQIVDWLDRKLRGEWRP